MTPRPGGAHAVLIVVLALLAGCAGPMGRREAEGYASRRLARFCGTACGSYHITGAQRMQDRWLVDFDSPRHKLSVLVNDGGNTEVTVWDKR
ncbi:MAG: hypothetical protein BGN85_08440 [Alphaproteobacteria bacterium 64-11]|nr:hypothetical protein [Alphaproteobacteria bacterium]OJU10640.1 MAG: hypothetical protein BGN85_08440 [Alphaproteobacteria bacterium 64-11]